MARLRSRRYPWSSSCLPWEPWVQPAGFPSLKSPPSSSSLRSQSRGPKQKFPSACAHVSKSSQSKVPKRTLTNERKLQFLSQSPKLSFQPKLSNRKLPSVRFSRNSPLVKMPRWSSPATYLNKCTQVTVAMPNVPSESF